MRKLFIILFILCIIGSFVYLQKKGYFLSQNESAFLQEDFNTRYLSALKTYGRSTKKNYILRSEEMIETAFLLKRPYFETTKSFFESESSDDTNGKQNHSSVSEDLSPNNTSDTSSQEIISLSSFPGTLGNTALLTGENYGTDVQIEPCLIFDYEIENGAPICLSKNSIFSIFSQSAKLF